MIDDDRYLKILAKSYPSIREVSAEIVRLRAMLTLPMGTEHFITDLHGEYDQFLHIIRNGSGAIRRKIEDEFGPDAPMEEKKAMAALIYYPEHKLAQVKRDSKETSRPDGLPMKAWYRETLVHLVRIARKASMKYTRAKVRQAIPEESLYLIEELMSYRMEEPEQAVYYEETIDAVIRTGQADILIASLAYLIRRLIVDHLHVIGDVFDRGPYPHRIMDALMEHHSVDIQWGNHDIEWMGAAAGCDALIANVLRNSARYGNLSILEDGYGINLIPLARFAMETYGDTPCKGVFRLRLNENETDVPDIELDEKIHRAVTILQLKLEGQIILRHPEYHMEDRLLLHHIDPVSEIVEIDGVRYPMRDMGFPTVNWSDPYRLTEAEEEVVERLRTAFLNSEKLQKHIRFLYKNGNLYKVYNGNLLYHGCVPLNEDGSFREVEIDGKKYRGKALYDRMEAIARKGYFAVDPEEKMKGLDMLFYLWEGADSPVFGKKKMATFENYYIEDNAIKKEEKNPYYRLLDDETVVNRILEEFGLGDTIDAHIVNGHVPVEAKSGESPIRCGGKLLIIDGGFSRAYHDKTGIAGYTLIFHSYGMLLAAHEPFESIEKAVREGSDIRSHLEVVRRIDRRRTVADTDRGQEWQKDLEDMERLLEAYRDGTVSVG